MANKQLTGNKGEWSEVYVLFQLLADGFLRSAVKEGDLISAEKCRVNSVIRNNGSNEQLCYTVKDQGKVVLYINDKCIQEYSASQFSDEAKVLLENILSGKNGAFAIPCTERFLTQLHIDRIKAASSDKSDITVDYDDVHAGGRVISGFSIKSYLGSSPTLLNASKQTKFRYRLSNIKNTQIFAELDKQKTPKKFITTINEYINSKQLSCNLEQCSAVSTTFKNNLKYICDNFETILGLVLYFYYAEKGTSVKDLVNFIKAQNPLNYPVDLLNLYEYRFKRFLSSIALGMQPSKLWNGYDEANGGYLVVTKEGDVIAYHLYHRNVFEDMLLEETKFETPSTSRHDFGTIKRDDLGYYFELCLQIRFK